MVKADGLVVDFSELYCEWDFVQRSNRASVTDVGEDDLHDLSITTNGSGLQLRLNLDHLLAVMDAIAEHTGHTVTLDEGIE